ncbi:MAG: hypothetical protein AB7I36_13545 [Rhodospirillaceae bacterium]
MTDDTQRSGASVPWAEQVFGTHINPVTLLASDYLNHFSEAIMLLGMVTDIPEVIQDLRAWRFKSYCEHFLQSNLDYGPLAAEAYAHAPQKYKQPFDAGVEALAVQLQCAIEEVTDLVERERPENLRETVTSQLNVISRLADEVSAVIAGHTSPNSQEIIDKLFE